MIAVVGAGPAGLALTHELEKQGCHVTLLERASVGATWSLQYEGLRLNSPKSMSELPGMRMPGSWPIYPTALQFHQYLKEYASRLRTRPLEGTTVVAATPRNGSGSGWWLETDKGASSCEQLVIATGTWSTPYIPPIANKAAYGGRVLHSKEFLSGTHFKGQRVLVVGGGSSAAEISTSLARAGVTVSIAIRGGMNIVPRVSSPTTLRLINAMLQHSATYAILRPLLATLRPDYSDLGIVTDPRSKIDLGFKIVVGTDFVEAVREGMISVHPSIRRFTAAGAEMINGATVACDSVILATGYRPTLDCIRQHVDVDNLGYPTLEGFRSTRSTSLYFVGLSYRQALREGWLPSLKRVAAGAARQIVAERGR